MLWTSAVACKYLQLPEDLVWICVRRLQVSVLALESIDDSGGKEGVGVTLKVLLY